MEPGACESFQRFPFTYDGAMREVFATPTPREQAVVVLHELPGLSPQACEFAEYLADEFQVYLPLFFGSIGQRSRARGMLPGGLQTLCVRAEFLSFQSQRSSPVAEWLRGLCRHLSAARGGTRVGVVGMCLTGSLVFSMAWDPSVGAAVAAQPALPALRLPDQVTASAEDLAATARCLTADTRMLALRFENDEVSPEQRLDAIEAAWGELVGRAPAADERQPPVPLTIVTYPEPPGGGRLHATLTLDAAAAVDPTFERARNRVRHFMLEALRP